MKVLSLGWGVQSWTLAAMVALGELEPVDFAIHADTTWEQEATYDFAKRWGPWLSERGVTLVTVSDAAQAAKVTTPATDIPAFTVAVDGSEGMLSRQCTSRWKIQPQRKFIAGQLKLRGLKKSLDVVEQWFGISLDEWTRAKDSDVRYIKHRYPLLERDMRRSDCVTWLERNGLEVPPKSACKFCPMRSPASWQRLKRDSPADFASAAEIDLQIRNVREPYQSFIHSARIPLVDAVKIPEDYGHEQLDMFNDACGVNCFL